MGMGMGTTTNFDVNSYLKRIRYEGSLEPTDQTLRDLHQAHLFTVPFENLYIQSGQPIDLDTDALFEKIVVQKRGGFCYELNGLFSQLLKAMGFDVTLYSAGVFHTANGYGPEYDHLTLMVMIDDERWLADVGFGSGFRHPLRLDDRGDQVQQAESFKIVDDGDYTLLMRRKPNEDWRPAYRFFETPRAFDEFFEMCVFHSTSPESVFAKRTVVMMDSRNGRLELVGNTFANTLPDGTREETQLDDDAYKQVLGQLFGVWPPRKNTPA